MIIKFIIDLILLITGTENFVLRNQSFEVRGKLLCGEKSVDKAAVELWEEDGPITKVLVHAMLKNYEFRDTILARVDTDERGEFIIRERREREIEVVPYLIIYHQCDIHHFTISRMISEFRLWRRFAVKIPAQYVNTRDVALRVFDLGVYNLQFQFADELFMENCNQSNDSYYLPCPYQMPAPFLYRIMNKDLFIH